jgi:DNA-binding transcriptional LysR family regulator
MPTMRDLNLRSVDLNLLPALEALLRRRHITRAAEEVGLSQPAMSHMLARLRRVLGDDLLVRGSSGFALTARAEEIAPRVAALLNAARAIYRPPPFEISKVRRVLHVAAADLHTILFLPDVMGRIRAEAPGIEISVHNYTRDIFKRLNDGSVDLVLADAETPLPPGAVSTVIGEDRYALVMREKHPAAGKRWRVAEYAKWDSVVVSIFGDGASDVDARLAKAGVARRIGLSTPHFMASLAAVSVTDMIATTSLIFAARHAKTFRLVVREPPLPEIRFTSTIIGSALRMNEPVISWFCALVKEVSETTRRQILRTAGLTTRGP